MDFLRQFVPTQYLIDNFDQVWPHVVEHVTISGKSLLIATLIALPLGLLLSRRRKLANPVLLLLGVIYTIPSFALFAFLVPFTGIGEQPAVIALVAYSLFILARNTMVGYNGVDPDVIEAARGMGMSNAQVLWRIETPLALPVIVAGLRIATLSTIALATIAAWIGAGGLGQLLRDSLNNIDHPSKLYAGLICIGVMAVGADLFFRLVERFVGVPAAARTPQGTSKRISASPGPVEL